METDDRSSFSVQNGVNCLSILDNVPFFDLTQCLPQDIMHVLLEGVVDRNCGQLLKRCIYKKHYFSLRHLNNAIATFKYVEREKYSQPHPLERERIINTEKLGQSGKSVCTVTIHLKLLTLTASQMCATDDRRHVLSDDKHWICFINLLRIMCISTAFEITQCN